MEKYFPFNLNIVYIGKILQRESENKKTKKNESKSDKEEVLGKKKKN